MEDQEVLKLGTRNRAVIYKDKNVLLGRFHFAWVNGLNSVKFR